VTGWKSVAHLASISWVWRSNGLITTWGGG
jgi:hypothetical protein